MPIEEGIIESIDSETGLLSVRFFARENSSNLVNSVYPYYSDVSGAMMGSMPQIGDGVLTLTPSKGGSHYVIGYKAMPLVTDMEPGESLNQFLGNRFPLSPGDSIISGRKHNRVLVEASGDVEVHANDVTLTRWSESDDRIQNIALNYEVSGFYGVSEWFTDRDEAREAAGITPTGMRSAFKRTAEGPPLIYENYGAILDEEGKTFLRNPIAGTDPLKGNLLYRFLIFDEATALRFAQHKMHAAPSAANLSDRYDDLGNSERVQMGEHTETIGGYSGVCRGNWGLDAWQVCTIEGGKGLDMASGRHASLTANTDIEIKAGRRLTLSSQELVIESARRTERAKGDLQLESTEDLCLMSGSDLRLTAVEHFVKSVGKSSSEVVRGTRNTVVENASTLNIAQDTASDMLRVYGGKLKHHVENGSYEVTIGPERSPLARIKLFQDMRSPQQIARIHIGFPATNTGLTMSPDGAWELKGTGGGIKCDVAGNITLGNPSTPVVGRVVTTLTHPTDYFTGLPINGHSQVSVTAGPPAPFMGVPSLGVMPPTVNLPELPPKG